MSRGPEYLRAADIARITGVSLRTARRWIAEKVIPSTKLGGARLVPRAELGRLLLPLTGVTDEATEEHDE
jgi:excisionase family DNA binding protein